MQRLFFALACWLLLGLTAQAASVVDPCALAGGNSGCSPTEMSFWELYDLIIIRQALGLDVAGLWLNLHLKFSIPLATFFTTLLVAPLGLLVSRLGSSVSTALSIVLVFLWYVIYSVCSPLGMKGALDPFLAAWIQNLIFGVGGLAIWAWFHRDRLAQDVADFGKRNRAL